MTITDSPHTTSGMTTKTVTVLASCFGLSDGAQVEIRRHPVTMVGDDAISLHVTGADDLSVLSVYLTDEVALRLRDELTRVLS